MTPAGVRWSGLAGSALIGASAWLGGSPMVRTHTVSVAEVFSGERGWWLPVCWVAGLALSLVAWWRGRTVVPSVRWAVVTVALWTIPVLPMLPLGSEDIYSYACQGFVQHAGGDPYAGGVAQFGCPWLDAVSTTWRDSPAPYGPLFLLLAGWAVALGHTLVGTIAALRVLALGGLALVAAGVPALARRCGVDPARAVWTVLACPIVLIHLVSGAHNDALMIGLLVAGMAVATARDSPAFLVAGGALIGLAGSVKATGLIVLPFLVLGGVLVRRLLLLGAGALAAMATVSLIAGRGVGWVFGLARSGDTVAWTSPSTAIGWAIKSVTGVNAVPAVRTVGVVALAGVLAWLWWRARTGDPLLGAGLALAATVLCAPVFHPWYATWPLAVLAAVRPAARWLLGWCAFAALLVVPSGYNWALGTRTAGSWVVTLGLLAAAAITVRARLTPADRVAA